MIKKLAYLTLLIMPIFAQAADKTPISEMPAGMYTNMQRHTNLLWNVNVLDLSTYIGHFDKVEAKLDFNPEDVTKSKLDVKIDAGSIRTTIDILDKRLKDGDDRFNVKNFNVAEFPEITFKSNKIEKLTENTGRIHGTLTMLGVSKEVVLDTKYNASYLSTPPGGEPIIGFSATLKLNRDDFGLKSYAAVVKSEVDVQVEIWFVKDKEE